MISVFGDESADETQQRTFAVGAVLAAKEEWAALEAQWIERTGGRPFHATDCESDKGIFSDSTHAENKVLYKDLVTILAESQAWGYGAVYDLESYRQIYPMVDQEICYLKALLFVVNFLAVFSEKRFKDTVRFTFDARKQSDYHTGKIYTLVASNPENRALMQQELLFSSPQICPRLQMADLFTYELMKELDNRTGPIKRTRRKSMGALANTNRFGCDVFLREYFEDMKRKLPGAEQRDSRFTRDAYGLWLQRFNRKDTTKNRLLFWIWFEEQERRQQPSS